MLYLNRNGNSPAFTLIELMVVVAILGLLAAIAAVNYQQHQTRTRVTQAQANMRLLAEALESYRVDQRAYPPAALADVMIRQPLHALTSPVAYLTGIPTDPFSPAVLNFNDQIRMEGYQYKDKPATEDHLPGETYGWIWQLLPDKAYYLHSAGPNRQWDVVPFTLYDPTNGSSSVGDLLRMGPM